MHKKTRNVLSGILVGIASLAAIINFADVPPGEVGNFVLSTSLFFLIIVLLALLCVCVFKLLGWIRRRLTGEEITSIAFNLPDDEKSPGEEEIQDEDTAGRDRE